MIRDPGNILCLWYQRVERQPFFAPSSAGGIQLSGCDLFRIRNKVLFWGSWLGDWGIRVMTQWYEEPGESMSGADIAALNYSM